MDLDLGVHKLVPFGLRVSQEVAAKMLAGTSVISTVAEGSASMMAHSHGCWLEASNPQPSSGLFKCPNKAAGFPWNR